MANNVFPKSKLPIRKAAEFLPQVFQTDANDKFFNGAFDPLIQPGTLEKTVGYIGKRYGKTYNGSDVYLDTDNTLRSRYQLEPAVVVRSNGEVLNFYDYIDLKNMLTFFGNTEERDDLTMHQSHYSWNPPIDWDKFINYREYYWIPSGPPPLRVYGQNSTVTSTYRVKLAEQSSFVFFPDGYTNNPTLTLYRGQKYKFIVNVPGNGFSIRTSYDTGSLLYVPDMAYQAGSLVLFDGGLWKAKVAIAPGDGSTIDKNSQDWEFVELANSPTALDYTSGLTNNGAETGTITFDIPYNAPDVLYYQSKTDPNRFGRILIEDIISNTTLDIEKEILNKVTYTSGNNIAFSNGMIVSFGGNVTPTKYSKGNWLVEGVGTKISLTLFDNLIVPVLNATRPEVLFDNDGFDDVPFDDATTYPSSQDYITIAKSSIDANPWSRYNRWFHKDVLEYSHSISGSNFDSAETSRAKRPIIEFQANLKLFQHGTHAKATVDFVDTFTTDVFSKIEGSTGYNIDGEDVFEGARILVVADTDTLANNQIYEIRFITFNGRKQITLKTVEDTPSIINETVLVKRGAINQGQMYYFNGSSWLLSQIKTTVNQPPLFDVFDETGISLGDTETYPVSTFSGTRIISYLVSPAGVADKYLGFALSHLNIDNIGDIQFSNDWDLDTFTYEVNRQSVTGRIITGYYKFNDTGEYANSWIETNNKYIQPIIDSQIITVATSSVTLTTVDWDKLDNDAEIYFYLNGVKITTPYTRKDKTFTFTKTFAANDVIVVKIFSNIPPDTGYYEIPVALEKNAGNRPIESFTFGQAVDHISTGLEFFPDFTGSFSGDSGNLRDISGYQQYSKRFLKHANLSGLSIFILANTDFNVIKSIKFAKKSYTEFKNNFLTAIAQINYDSNIANFVDAAIKEITKAKTNANPFLNSDMIGSGSYTPIYYTVEDTGIKTFALSEQFSLDLDPTHTRRAVYVYHNDRQLIVNKEYDFNLTFPFVNLKIDLQEGDNIEIREYTSTAINYIPETPTKLGMYKKYLPGKFLDDTYITPRMMIQGHDGSLITAFGDYRDDAILELELRIYNNIKSEYDEKIFDNDMVLGGYYNTGIFGRDKISEIINREFLSWISNSNVNYITNNYFDSENSFTYTYSKMNDPLGSQNLLGWWRGIYKWFYDTDRPHTCPWEMLGFSEKPTWWESEYGSAPYTSNNLILWEDLTNGIIRHGTRAGQHIRYARSTLLSHIPVDGDGKLLSPLESGLAQNFSLVNANTDFALGDISPVEHAWYNTSEYPFAISLALSLLRPIDFIGQNFNRIQSTTNILNQKIYRSSGTFIIQEDLLPDNLGTTDTNGLVNWAADYLKSQNTDIGVLGVSVIAGIDIALTHRLSGFVDQGQQKFILDSKTPSSTSGNVFVPPENQKIFFNVSTPISTIVYSGVIIEKLDRGWKIRGYDSLQPYFKYFEAIPTQADGLMTVGGVSEEFIVWTASQFFGNGVIIQYQNEYYRSLSSHTSGASFDPALWKKLPNLPKKNAVEALNRTGFNTVFESTVTYGTVLTSIQSVVDFLFGYEQYLISQGFKFDRYDSNNKVTQNWTTSAKEFMYWTVHNWATGSLITLSPAAEKLDMSFAIGVPANLLDSFYDYQVYKSNGTPIAPTYLNIKREVQHVTIETTNTTDGIYFFKAHLVIKEHVVIFDDRTVFNDIIYDKTTGYRQERIKSRGFRTVDWTGDYISPGFIYDNVNIQVWQPYTDYKLGDIVLYKTNTWTSQRNQVGSLEFDTTKWSILDSTPQRSLVPNFDYRINQFSDYYNLDSDGLESSQRDLGRHAVGYQKREYLQNLAEDDVTQFQLYQGFIRDKGTLNAATKIFDKLSKTTEDAIVLNEEWAFNVGTFGGKDQLREIEFSLDKGTFQLNPQPIVFVSAEPSAALLDQYLRIPPSRFTKADSPFVTNMLPKIAAGTMQTAGYVKLDQIDYILKSRSDIVGVDIAGVKENDHFWITFDSYSWTVLRLNKKSILSITSATKDSASVTLTFNRDHKLAVGDIIGISDIQNLTGFFEITAVTLRTVTVTVAANAQEPMLDQSTVYGIYGFTEARIKSSADLSPTASAALRAGSKLWLDSVENIGWQVVEKNKVFEYKKISNYGTTVPLGAGSAVLHADILKQTIVSMPASSVVTTYLESDTLQIKQIILPELVLEAILGNSFGSAMAVSPDNRWLVIGAPYASGALSHFRGEYSANVDYDEGDIILSHGKLWTANKFVPKNKDDSTRNIIGLGSSDWDIATVVSYDPVHGTNVGPLNQGLINIYQWTNNNWQLFKILLSPRIAANELFGSKISIGFDGFDYWMSVSAPGALANRGRVYLFKFSNTEWVMHENNNYRGIYESNVRYHKGSIVWWDGKLWEAQVDINEDSASDSTIAIQSNDPTFASEWKQIDPVFTQNSLPTNIALVDDGSTLGLGLLSKTQQAELTKLGDQFGSSIAMNTDGSILVVGAPDSDGEYFENYKGEWTKYQEYQVGDVVKYVGNNNNPGYSSQGYYKLIDPRNWTDDTTYDSTLTFNSVNQSPENGDPWASVGDSSSNSTGKIYIYQRDSNQIYQLKQTVTAQTLNNINDTGTPEYLYVGDKFGFAVDVDATGKNIVVSSPLADINLQNQGSVYYLNSANLDSPNWRLKQKLESYDEYNNILFGSSVSISAGTERIVVGAKNTPYKKYSYFSDNTIFDKNTTTFSELQGYAGQVYSFERVGGKYLLSEKLQADLQEHESFGHSVDATADVIVVGSPNYQTTTAHLIDDIVIGTRYTIVSTGNNTRPTDFTLVGAITGDVGESFIATRAGIVSAGNFTIGKIYTIRSSGTTVFTSIGAADNEPGTAFKATGVGSGSGTAVQGTGTVSTIDLIGTVRTFTKINGQNSFTTLGQQQLVTDTTKIKNIALIDNVKNIKIADVDIVDNAKLKILDVAEQELKFKTPYDPATYTNGTDEQIVSPDSAWFEKNVGRLWWNLSTAKWVYYEQGDTTYKIGNWNKLSTGASIDVYEWVESVLLPSEWSALADTADGISNGISGQPLYPNDDVYSVKQIYNPTTQLLTETRYYYWVKGSTVSPTNVVGRKFSAAAVAALIIDPAILGTPTLAIVDSDTILAYNFANSLTSGSGLLNIQLYKDSITVNPVHKEYLLLSEGVADSIPNAILETKWIDSLVGFDQAGNPVPDSKLPDRDKYGLGFRPRQSMFKNKSAILQVVVNNINTILATRPFSDTLNFNTLNLFDNVPVVELNDYDDVVTNLTDLTQYPVNRVRRAILTPNIINGEIDTIDIIDPGFGYKVAPYIEIEGAGAGATASVTIDKQGRISSVLVLTKGKRYDSAIIKIREYSVLVETDSTIAGYWAIYSWDQDRNQFYRRKAQGYDTRRYWESVDWWMDGYTPLTKIAFEIPALYLEPTLIVDIGELIRVREYGNGGWAVLVKVNAGQGDVLGNYILVGRYHGTIALKDSLYNTSTTAIGYDNVGFYDTNLYDLYPAAELRNILKAVKEDIFVDDLAVEWNKLFFASISYAFSEQPTINWAFKTSFINAIHNVGTLEQKLNYKNDNLPAYQQYLEEIKPYRTSIREYTSRYNFVEPSNTTAVDFDLPPVYSPRDGRIVPVGQGYNLFDQYPWKFWADNQGFSIAGISVSYGGENYTTPPTVIIEGNGTGAKAKAFVSNGVVSGIEVTSPGKNYTLTPTVTLVGGNGSSLKTAKASVILGDSKARIFDTTLKFDRITKDGLLRSFSTSQNFVSSGITAVFDLAYAPTRDKNKIKIYKNKQLVLNSEYSLQFYRSKVDTYQLLKGKLIFVTPVQVGDTINIEYDKNDELLDGVNRIQKYYAPADGMIGNDVGQLMTGIDFGGVQVQGTTFEITGGWDALPWFTDGWDSVDPNSDYYVVVDGSTAIIKLPFVPADGQMISIYVKRADTKNTVRIDDPFYDRYDGSTVQANGLKSRPSTSLMPSFRGDGSTTDVSFEGYFRMHAGDLMIFRPFESDGSVEINDPNLLDTKITGGSLAAIGGAYSTATGRTPEEIILDGDGFITPTQVPAPEENIPGQVLDSVSIKVFQNTNSGSSPMQNTVLFSDGSTTRYPIGLTVLESSSVLVYVNKVKYGYYDYNDDSNLDYTISFNTNEIIFFTAPPVNALIEIIAIGRGGVGLLDYQEFITDGNTDLFLTQAEYATTQSVFVTLDGDYIDTRFTNSSDIAVTTGAEITPDKAIVQFANKPAAGQVVKIIAFGASLNSDSSGQSIIRVNNQRFNFTGSTRTFELDRFIDLSRSSTAGSMLVMLNNKKLRGPDTYYAVYDGTNNNVLVGTDPVATITAVDIKVYINNILQPFVTAYVYNGTTKTVTVNTAFLTLQDVIKIEILVNAQYLISANNNLTINSNVAMISGDRLEVTWFSEYATYDIISDTYAGGKVNYSLSRDPLDSNYVWVYLNGERLVNGTDFYVSLPRNVVYITSDTTSADAVEIIQFGNQIYKDPRAYEIYKDMLNITHYTRYSLGEVKLAADLNYYDTEIVVSDASMLDNPIANRNIPGAISIRNERIEYLTKTGNILGQLRRGSLGSAIGISYPAGTRLSNAGASDTISYSDTQEKEDFISGGPTTFVYDGSTHFELNSKVEYGNGNKDNLIVTVNNKLVNASSFTLTDTSTGGFVILTTPVHYNDGTNVALADNDVISITSLLAGPLNFIPLYSDRAFTSRSKIPTDYGMCDQLDVFVAGRRLRKDSLKVFSEELGASSPTADTIVAPEFSVDGVSNYIRITEPVPAGTRILIIRKTGKIWYDRAETTASKGITLLDNLSPIARFIDQKSTELPE